MNINDLFPAKWLAPSDMKGRSAVVEVEQVTLEDVFNPRHVPDRQEAGDCVQGRQEAHVA